MTEDLNRIEDAKALRALAHPIRWKLIDVLGRENCATATYCAREIGESVASCSYHLNMLAKYDYVEQAEGGQGREKPWRLTQRQQSWGSVGLDTEGALAAEAATEAFLDHEFALAKQRYRADSLEPDEWRAALGAQGNTEWLTADEVTQLRDEYERIMTRFRDRRDNPELRPPDARPVRLFLSISVPPRT